MSYDRIAEAAEAFAEARAAKVDRDSAREYLDTIGSTYDALIEAVRDGLEHDDWRRPGQRPGHVYRLAAAAGKLCWLCGRPAAWSVEQADDASASWFACTAHIEPRATLLDCGHVGQCNGHHCSVCSWAIEDEPAGYTALEGYTFTLPLCDHCASSARMEAAKDRALRAYAVRHPETRTAATT